MTQTLREQQKQVARDLILRATADEIVENGLDNLSLQVVAGRAGVSNRTLYNYFENREGLLRELSQFSDRLTVEYGGTNMPTDLDSLPDLIPVVWRAWEAQGNVYRAVMQIAGSSANGHELHEDRVERAAALSSFVAALRPDLEPEQHKELGSLLHALCSSALFNRMTTTERLETDRAGRLVGWTLNLVREALEQGDDPFHTTAEES